MSGNVGNQNLARVVAVHASGAALGLERTKRTVDRNRRRRHGASASASVARSIRYYPLAFFLAVHVHRAIGAVVVVVIVVAAVVAVVTA